MTDELPTITSALLIESGVTTGGTGGGVWVAIVVKEICEEVAIFPEKVLDWTTT